MRPDRIIVGEVRGPETLDMLQAMNTGHEGSLTTIHANTPRDALHRLEMLVLMGGVELPLRGGARADRLGVRPDHPPRAPDRRQPAREPDHRGVRPRRRRRHAAGPVRHRARPRTTLRCARGTSLLGPLRSTGLRPNFLDEALRPTASSCPTNAFEEALRLTRRRVAAVVAAALLAGGRAGQAGRGGQRRLRLRQVELGRLPRRAARRARGADDRRSRRRSSRTGSRCAGVEVQSLGQSKAIMLAIDRSKSMHGAPLDRGRGGGEAVPAASKRELGSGRRRDVRLDGARAGAAPAVARSTPTTRCARSRPTRVEGHGARRRRRRLGERARLAGVSPAAC